MLEGELRSAADVLIKLGRALPRSPGDQLTSNRKFTSSLLRIGAALPSHGYAGLGDANFALLDSVISAMHGVARSDVQRGRTDAPTVDLLRSLAAETDEAKAELLYDRGATLARTFSSLQHTPLEMAHFREALAKAELSHDVIMRGLRVMRSNLLGSGKDVFHEAVNAALPTVTRSMVLWVFPTLFDGLRLRRGLELAARLGIRRGGESLPFGLDGVAHGVLTDGETVLDAIRVARSAQFLIGAMRIGVCSYLGDDEAPDSLELELVEQLEARIRSKLEDCRRHNEQKCVVPGKQLRTVLDSVADFVERAVAPGEANEAAMLALQLAFAVPCLQPSRLAALSGYDGGDLSLWDACHHLLLLKEKELHTTDPPVALVAQVLGGVVGSLTSQALDGPFVVNADLQREVDSLIEAWPNPKTRANWPELYDAADQEASRRPSRRAIDAALASNQSKGKNVGPNQAICEAIESALQETASAPALRFKSSRARSELVDARSAAALTMASVASGFERCDPGTDTHPTDGIMQLKRLYLIALGAEPGLPVPTCTPNPFVEQAVRRSSATAATDAIETPWRDIAGGATLLVGPLYEFTKQAFKTTLIQDWLPMECVKRALQDRAEGKQRRPPPAMLPAQAMRKLGNHAKALVAKVVTDVRNQMDMSEGPIPPRSKQALECFSAWANTVYDHAAYAPLWECCILSICSSSSGGAKRPRPPGSAGAARAVRARSPLSVPPSAE